MLSVCIASISCILVKTNLKSAFSPKAVHSIYIKIFANYLQLVFLTTQFNSKYPSTVVNLFAAQKPMGAVTGQISHLTVLQLENTQQTLHKLIKTNSFFFQFFHLSSSRFLLLIGPLYVFTTRLIHI